MPANLGWGKRKREYVDWESKKRKLVEQPRVIKGKVKITPLWIPVAKTAKTKQ